MNPQDYSSRTRYRPPAAWYRRINNGLGVLLTSLGLAPRDAVTLEVRGRRSGRRRRTPILRTPYRGEDYLVALAGESEWVRNVRAAEGRVLLVGPFAAGLVAKGTLLRAMHVLMLPCMYVAMVRRREEYEQGHSGHTGGRHRGRVSESHHVTPGSSPKSGPTGS